LIEWILNNKEWLFSGLGLAVLGAVWGLLRYGYNRWTEGKAAILEPAPVPPRIRPTYDALRTGGSMGWLPTFLLRMTLRPEKVAAKIHIDLRGENPIDLSLNSEVPNVSVYFEITNLSPLDLTLDRLLVEIWFGQPTLVATLLRRYTLPAGQITKNVFLRHMLSNAQRSQIQDFMNSGGTRGQIHIYLTAYLESRVGRIEIERNIERQKLA